jgi:hypothetical protein
LTGGDQTKSHNRIFKSSKQITVGSMPIFASRAERCRSHSECNQKATCEASFQTRF